MIKHILLPPNDYDNVIGYSYIDEQGEFVSAGYMYYGDADTPATFVFLIDEDGVANGQIKLPVRIVKSLAGHSYANVQELYRSLIFGDAYAINREKTVEIPQTRQEEIIEEEPEPEFAWYKSLEFDHNYAIIGLCFILFVALVYILTR
jgi:hypothetical protein